MASQVDLICALDELARRHSKRVFRLREIAAWLGLARPAAGMLLLRAARDRRVWRVGTLWIDPRNPPSRHELALALRSPSYVSFESALFERHALSQSPRGEFTVAHSGRPQRFATPLGAIRFIHLKPALVFGFDERRVAYPEKAWLDLLYIRGLRTRKPLLSEEFHLDLLDAKRLEAFARRFPPWVRDAARRFRDNF